MKLWLLKPIQDWEPRYDKAFGFVVRAGTEEVARAYASKDSGAEGSEVWLDPQKTSCVVLSEDGEPGTILRDFAAA